MRWRSRLAIIVWLVAPISAQAAGPDFVEIRADVLADKIGGGLLGEILGNLNGLAHEGKYVKEPGRVDAYVPSLPEGARSDDDTDIEWVYIVEMQRSREIFLPARRIVALWRAHINDRIWCANRYARGLMDLGIEPPLTGRMGINPWAEFNISGQFVCEAFGLIAPAMPQTASKIGLHYTHVAIDGEPAQATQFFCTMIATAFVERDVPTLVSAAREAVDPRSEIYQAAGHVIAWWKAHPADWRATRAKIRDTYMRHGGSARDATDCTLNGAAVVGALLYGGGDFVETLRLAFNFGWDADCNAATAGAVLGVIQGREWMAEQGWTIVDRYRNLTRPGMPTDETIGRYADRLVDVAKTVILKNGGSEADVDGVKVFRIRRQRPANVEPRTTPEDRLVALRRELASQLMPGLTGGPADQARAAYLAICLDDAQELSRKHPDEWKAAVEALRGFPTVLSNLFKAPEASAGVLQARAKSLGLQPASSIRAR